jgi:hypothetical protein
MDDDVRHPTFEEETLDDMVRATPEEFANLEAAKEQNRELWHRRLLKLFRRRDPAQ